MQQRESKRFHKMALLPDGCQKSVSFLASAGRRSRYWHRFDLSINRFLAYNEYVNQHERRWSTCAGTNTLPRHIVPRPSERKGQAMPPLTRERHRSYVNGQATAQFRRGRPSAGAGRRSHVRGAPATAMRSPRPLAPPAGRRPPMSGTAYAVQVPSSLPERRFASPREVMGARPLRAPSPRPFCGGRSAHSRRAGGARVTHARHPAHASPASSRTPVANVWHALCSTSLEHSPGSAVRRAPSSSESAPGPMPDPAAIAAPFLRPADSATLACAFRQQDQEGVPLRMPGAGWNGPGNPASW